MGKWLFSVVIPAYNAERYIDEAVESVVAQSVGFRENIQIILVDDGSTDGTERRCRRWVEKFPDNIEYIRQKNAGVSVARNTGIGRATGEFVNFLDSDDKWEVTVFDKVLKMFRKNPQMDAVGVRQEFFEAQTGPHALDYKFDRDKVVDINGGPEQIQLCVTAAFVRRSAIKEIRFEPKLKYAEDLRFMTEVILQNGLIGLIASARHWYRKRASGDSAMQKTTASAEWYEPTLRHCHRYLIELSERKFGTVIPYVQFVLMYDLQWRANTQERPSGEKEWKKYLSAAWEVLDKIDDEVVLAQRFLTLEKKSKLLELKYGATEYMRRCGKWRVDGRMLKEWDCVWVSVVELDDDGLDISGTLTAFGPISEMRLVAGEEKKPVELDAGVATKVSLFGEEFASFAHFRVKVPGKTMPSFWLNGKEMFVEYGPGCRRVTREKRARSKGEKAFRAVVWGLKHLTGRKIWLISDRRDAASDNGLAFYKYMRARHRGVNCHFVLNEDSPDWEKVPGKKVAFGSRKHRLLYCAADKVISSQATLDEYDPLPATEMYNDLASRSLVFLQHGVTSGDVSEYCGRYEKNIRLVVTTGKAEREIFLDKKYGYTEGEVAVTGFPRYDLLKRGKAEKIILVAPTWRTFLPTEGEKLVQTEYFGFYDKLLNDEKLLRALKKHGYRMIFAPHPNVIKHLGKFRRNDLVEMRERVNYTELLNRAALMVTDFSSVAYDFAYLGKPVIYAQFDTEEVERRHSVKPGNYKKHGFGPVAEDYDATVKEILRCLENETTMEEKYRQRAEKFFAFNDAANCERVYQAIKRLG